MFDPSVVSSCMVDALALEMCFENNFLSVRCSMGASVLDPDGTRIELIDAPGDPAAIPG